jgi:uncharacterized protein
MRSACTFILSIFVYAATVAQPGNKIIIGTIDSVQSKILNEQRKVWVYVPNSEANDLYSRQKYPVVYLLDGDGHFHSVVGMIQQLSQVNGNTICPEMIVVGITNTNRMRDLSPTKIKADPPFMDSALASQTGGGDLFSAFIEKELIPHIDSLYPTQPYKMLIGHSLGGLLVMHTLAKQPKLFNACIAIDPSMWWDNMKYLNTLNNALSKNNFNNTALYVGIANTMEEGMDLKNVSKDTSDGTKHIRSIIAMDKHLKTQPQNKLRYASKYYDNDDHGSVPLVATYDALRFFFEKYRMKLSNNDFMDTTTALVDKFRQHYQQVSAMFGYTVKPPEHVINGMGYQSLQLNQRSRAGAFFKMNVDNYPESFNVYDSYGDYFLAIGDKQKAIEYFRKSLSVKETPASREKLDKLTK